MPAYPLNVSYRLCFMRGDDQQQFGVFSYVSLEERIPQDHPLRPIRKTVDQIFSAMSKEFDGLYAKTGRPSIPPGDFVRANSARRVRVGPTEWLG